MTLNEQGNLEICTCKIDNLWQPIFQPLALAETEASRGGKTQMKQVVAKVHFERQ